MRLRDDERGQSVQIGAVLLFATLIVAFSSYQAFVVPQQNEEIEFNHNTDVRGEMQDLRNVVVDQRGSRGTDAVSLTLGTGYPSRLAAQNPGPVSGSVRTLGTTDAAVNVTIANASADGETGDVWNGTARAYETGAITYRPNYNLYDEAPDTVYENSVLYDEFRSATRPAADQVLIDGNRISVVTVNGSLSRTRTDRTSVDVESVSTSTRTVSVADDPDGANVTLLVPTRLSRSDWVAMLEPEFTANGGHVTDVSTVAIDDPTFDLLRIELERDVDYRLRMKKVGVGSGVSDEPPAYLTDTGDTDWTGRSGDVLDVVVEARDGYNNPVPDTAVNASVSSGSVSPERGTTDEDGRLVVRYDTSGVSPGTYEVKLSLDAVDGDFDNETARDVTVPVTVTNSSGSAGGDDPSPYSIEWDTTTTSDQPAVEYYASNDTVVVGAGSDSTVDVTSRATNDDGDGVSGVFVDYASADQSVAEFETSEDRTGSDGRSTVPLTVGPGSTTIYAATLVGTDSLTVKTTLGGTYYRYYEGDYSGGDGYMPDFDSQTPVKTGNVSTFDVGPSERDDGFGFVYTASIDVPADGTYTFYTNSDDGSRLYVDGDQVVDNSGDQQVQEESGDVTLSEGRHDITVTYYENYGEAILDVSWEGPGFGKEEIPSSVLTPRVTSGSGGDTGGNHAPTVDTLQTTDSSVTSGGTKYAQFDVDWEVSDDTDLQSIEQTMTRVSTGNQVDSATPPVSGTTASGTTTLRGPDQSSNPSGQQYDITATVTDSNGTTTTQTQRVTVS